jgi:signal transduction histidine kinase
VEKPRFVGKTIQLLLLSSLLGFLGVLAVDLFIEHRQVDASAQVAASTISTAHRMGHFEVALQRYHEAATSAARDGAAREGLSVARDQLAGAMQQFDPYVGSGDRATWQSLRERMLAFEGATPLEGTASVAALEERIRALTEDLGALARIVDRTGLAELVRAEQMHTLHGALEALVLFLMGGASLALLLVWRRQEARAHQRDTEVEEQLRRALGDLDTFAGRLAHDLRSPLQPILSSSQSIERAPVPTTVRRQAERIEHAAKRLGRMVEAVLQFTRASATGALEREHVHAHVNAAVDALLPELDEAARARGGRIAAHLGPDATLACAAEVVQSLVWNLVDNALKYGVKEGEPPSVTVRTRVEDSLGVIEVEDRGPGIPPELRARVFEPLFRGHAAGEGIGLGLSIVDRVVTTLGGRVELLSGEEGGALFRILVPIESAEVSAGAGSAAVPEPKAPKAPSAPVMASGAK